MDKSTAKPLRAAQAQVSAPEITVHALYRSAIGIDVHLNLLVCCHQTQLDDHQELSEIVEFNTDRSSLDKFAAWCRERDPSIILMESTGVLWISPYEALENVGFGSDRLALINARDAKAAVGRKTDRKDASRLAELARSGHFRRSFVPPKDFRIQRFISREYQKIKSELSVAKNRHQKLLNSTGCRASIVFSDVHGKAASAILEAKINNDPQLSKIISANCGRLRATPEMIEDALNFEIEPLVAEQLRRSSEHLKELHQYAENTFNRLRKLQQPYEAQIKLLRTIPGVQEISARLIFAELCGNLKDYFVDSEHFTSWLGICPGDNTSAGKQKSGSCPKGNKWLRRTLVECVRGYSLSGRCPSKEKFQALKLRRGYKRAVVAMAHLLARIVYSVLLNNKAFEPQETNAHRDAVVVRILSALKEAKRFPKSGIGIVDGRYLMVESTGAIIADLYGIGIKPV